MLPHFSFEGIIIVRFMLGFILFCFLAIAMLPFMSFVALCMKVFKKHIFYERCAFQLTQLGSFLSVVLGCLILFATVIYWKEIQSLSPVFAFIFWFLSIIFYAGIFIEVLTFSFWKQLLENPLFQIIIMTFPGILYSIISISIAFLVAFSISGELSLFQHETDLRILLDILSTTSKNYLWFVIIVYFIEAVAAGSIGLLWLCVRRKLDNFGRDYYTFATKWCAWWSAYSAWVLLFCFIILVYSNLDIITVEITKVLFVAVFNIFAAVLWTIIAISKTPMRNKIGMVFAIISFIYAVLEFESLFLG